MTTDPMLPAMMSCIGGGLVESGSTLALTEEGRKALRPTLVALIFLNDPCDQASCVYDEDLMAFVDRFFSDANARMDEVAFARLLFQELTATPTRTGETALYQTLTHPSIATVINRQFGSGRAIRSAEEFVCLFALYLLSRAVRLGLLKVVPGEADGLCFYAHAA